MTFPMSVGAAAVLLPDRPTPDAVLDTMQRHQPTMFGGVPTLYAAMLANPRDRAGRRLGRGCAAASRPARRCPRISAGAGASMVGVDILDGIGSTEMLHIFLSQPRRTTSATAHRASRCRAMRR